MELPYRTLIQIAWELWWRYLVCVVVVAFAVVAPLAIIAFLHPIVWEAIQSSRLDRELVLFALLPGFQLLACFPMAVKWFLRQRAAALGVSASYCGKDPNIGQNPDRQVFLLSWSVFWMTLLWTLTNSVVVYLLFPPYLYTGRTITALVLISGNVAVLTLVAVLPMNIQWAFKNPFLGTCWELNAPDTQSR